MKIHWLIKYYLIAFILLDLIILVSCGNAEEVEKDLVVQMLYVDE